MPKESVCLEITSPDVRLSCCNYRHDHCPQVEEELSGYDDHTNNSFSHTWLYDEARREKIHYPASSYAVDANTTFTVRSQDVHGTFTGRWWYVHRTFVGRISQVLNRRHNTTIAIYYFVLFMPIRTDLLSCMCHCNIINLCQLRC